MRNILDELVEGRRRELAQARIEMPLTEMEKRIGSLATPVSLSRALSGEGVSLIAEVKKASPSRGLLAHNFDPVKLAWTYARNGASAISVLTETPHFRGSLDHLKSIKEGLASGCPPLLRKDFIFDSYQVYEARAWGADAILLIATILDSGQIRGLIAEARGLGMECVVEVHNESEIETALAGDAEIIGINNRDLSDFQVDLDTTRRLRPLVPREIPVVAESGIFGRDEIARLEAWGVDAVLVGEALVTALDVGEKVRELAGAVLPVQGRPED